MVSSVPGSISSIVGSVVILGIVVGGLVAGGRVGLDVGWVVVLVVVAVLSVPRQPVSTHIVRTRANARMLIFFMMKPPENSDFKASISKPMPFKLGTFVEAAGFGDIFIKKPFLALLFFALSSIIFEKTKEEGNPLL